LYLTPFLDENLLKEDYTGPGPMLAWYTQDGLGSVRQLVVGDAVQNSYTYTSWGVPLQWHEKVSNRYTFTGREHNAETHDYHYRARHYAPCIGRFLSRDPLSTAMWYLYTSNEPVCRVDPLGDQDKEWERVNDHVWRAKKDKADIRKLLSLVLKKDVDFRKDWMCLIPVCMKKKRYATTLRNLTRLVSKGDEFDVSNLTASASNEFKAIVIQGGAEKQFFSNMKEFASFEQFMDSLADACNWGKKPITLFILAGHTGKNYALIPPPRKRGWEFHTAKIRGWFRKKGRNAPNYNKPRGGREGYEIAREGKLPFHCWFAKGCHIWFVGCYTSHLARNFSRLYTRKGAGYVCGTTRKIWVQKQGKWIRWGTNKARNERHFLNRRLGLWRCYQIGTGEVLKK